MELVFRPEAEAELLEAQAWYEGRSAGLGLEFARAADAAAATALRNPFACPALDDEFRHLSYVGSLIPLLYMLGAHELLVVSCFHHRREPGSWRRRVAG